MKLLDTKTHIIEVPEGAIVNPHIPIRIITTQAFFRRMTSSERAVIRDSLKDSVADLRDDLQRSDLVDLDGILRQQLIDTTVLSTLRIDELLVDGK